jgi:outer membrane immunogenic protein
MSKFVLASIATLAVSAPAFAADFRGPRVEAHVGWDRVQAKLSAAGVSAKGHDNGIFFGGEIGYDFSNENNAVFGVLAAIHGSGVKACEVDSTERVCVKAGRDIEAGARAGFIVAPQTLIYGKVSYANLQIRARYTDSAAPADNFSGHDERGGIRFGAGIERSFSKNVYAKVEYRYTDYKNYRADIAGTDVSLGLSRHQILGGIGGRF